MGTYKIGLEDVWHVNGIEKEARMKITVSVRASGYRVIARFSEDHYLDAQFETFADVVAALRCIPQAQNLPVEVVSPFAVHSYGRWEDIAEEELPAPARCGYVVIAGDMS